MNLQIIDLENSIRNHNNRIEDLEVEKLHLEAEVVELKGTVERNPISDQLQAVTSHKNQLEIEVNIIILKVNKVIDGTQLNASFIRSIDSVPIKGRPFRILRTHWRA